MQTGQMACLHIQYVQWLHTISINMYDPLMDTSSVKGWSSVNCDWLQHLSESSAWIGGVAAASSPLLSVHDLMCKAKTDQTTTKKNRVPVGSHVAWAESEGKTRRSIPAVIVTLYSSINHVSVCLVSLKAIFTLLLLATRWRQQST